ncbi:hypothetical protein K469DRAFT_21823 [Zopfia rhizophila CBS 207.26]|uniref:Uncharacterized protein n=1 Tax=Zopfia rhizophila CBS 207.26 TaxID=1314779 RepID=A0A6A6EJB7_9PEZI|nr:hypothetical protein K469DRAFT_21823 [Zopfia rhizophila CBS 207.26]
MPYSPQRRRSDGQAVICLRTYISILEYFFPSRSAGHAQGSGPVTRYPTMCIISQTEMKNMIRFLRSSSANLASHKNLIFPTASQTCRTARIGGLQEPQLVSKNRSFASFTSPPFLFSS